jgi:DNA-binding HxlR family transcriptional regulator
VAKTAEIVCERWSPLIVRELLCGSRRFSEIQRGVPGISPALLATRLRRLEVAGVIEKRTEGHLREYAPTAAGWELYPIIEAMGVWGQRWARSSYTPDDLDPAFLMWDMRRMLQPVGLAEARTVVEFRFRAAPSGHSRFWLIVDESIDLCLVDPRSPVDMTVDCDVRRLTQVWIGDIELTEAIRDGGIRLTGPRPLLQRFPNWLGRHPVLGHVEAIG